MSTHIHVPACAAWAQPLLPDPVPAPYEALPPDAGAGPELRLSEARRTWPRGCRVRHVLTRERGTVHSHVSDAFYPVMVRVVFDHGSIVNAVRVNRLEFAVGRDEREILAGASGLIARNGWRRRGYFGRHCLSDARPWERCLDTLGALAVSAGLDAAVWDRADDLGEQDGDRYVHLVRAVARLAAVLVGPGAGEARSVQDLCRIVADAWNDAVAVAPGQMAATLLAAAGHRLGSG